MDAKPLIDRLLHASAAFRQRHAAHRETAGGPAVDEQIAHPPLTRAQRREIAWLQRNSRLAAERIERSPWTLGIRAGRAQAELTGSNEAFDGLVRRYKKYEAKRWPR